MLTFISVYRCPTAGYLHIFANICMHDLHTCGHYMKTRQRWGWIKETWVMNHTKKKLKKTFLLLRVRNEAKEGCLMPLNPSLSNNESHSFPCNPIHTGTKWTLTRSGMKQLPVIDLQHREDLKKHQSMERLPDVQQFK